MTLMTRTARGAALLACLGAPALADDGFGGSFDDPAGTEVAPAADTGTDAGAAEQSDAKAPEPAAEAQADTAQTAESEAADDGFGGSFGPDAGAEPEPATAEPAAMTEDGNLDPDFGIAGEDTEPADTSQEGTTEASPEAEENIQPADALTITVDPQILAFESRDYGVPPTSSLRNSQMHAATPTSVPGAQVVSTEGLANAMADQIELILVDVLGGEYALPGAYMIPEMSQAGSFGDRIQQQTEQWLAQVTGRDADYPVILYCADPECWLSYNATLRVVAAGYTNVYWYRGGITAWQMAGFQVYPSGY